jgi:photosystem II stability/assembly factor-like uncharacterized protein
VTPLDRDKLERDKEVIMSQTRRISLLAALLLAASPLVRAGDGVWTTSGPAANVVTIAADASAPGVVYAATAHALYVSLDGGLSWRAGATTTGTVQALLVLPGSASTLLVGTDSGVFRSTDAAAHLEETDLTDSASSLTTDRFGSVIFAAAGANRQLTKSTDGGAHWSSPETVPVPDSLLSKITAIVLHPTRPNVSYAGLDVVMDYATAAISRTTDGGGTWETVADFGYGHYRPGIGALAIDPTDSDGVFGTTSYGGLVQSYDGNQWSYGTVPFYASTSALASDPGSQGVYAGTDVGVFHSAHNGSDWRTVGGELPDPAIRALAVEPGANRLHAATPSGVYDLDVPPAPAVEPCAPDAASLCLLGGRFRVRLTARNLRTGVFGPGTASAQGDRFGFFSLPEFTGDPALPEVLVKMVDATAAPGRSFWFFHTGLTTLPYLIEVQDTATGELRTFTNQGWLCGGADTSAFFAGGAGSAAAPAASAASSKASLLPAGTPGPLRLLGGRFEVTLAASDPKRDRSASGAAIPWNDRAGYFSLPDFTGDPSFPEVAVKMVDYTAVNGQFWFFFSGLTHLPYTLTVRDTVTGQVRTYQPDAPFCGGADTSAFVVAAGD